MCQVIAVYSSINGELARGVERRVLITGSTGFLGRSLYRHLESEGYDVIGSTRKLSDDSIDQNNIVIPTLGPKTDWSEALTNCDIVVHAAARVHMFDDISPDTRRAYKEVNTLASINLAEQAVKHGVKRLVFISSIGVNGAYTRGVAISIDSTPNPISPYAVSKFEAENGLWEVARNSPMELVIIRAPAIYGVNAPGNFRLISNAIRRGIPMPFGAVRNKRSFIYIDNLTSFVEICLTHSQAADNLFIVSDGEDLSTPEIIEVMSQLLSKRPIIFGFPKCLLRLLFRVAGKANASSSLLSDFQIDSSFARNRLNWEPPVNPKTFLKK